MGVWYSVSNDEAKLAGLDSRGAVSQKKFEMADFKSLVLER